MDYRNRFVTQKAVAIHRGLQACYVIVLVGVCVLKLYTIQLAREQTTLGKLWAGVSTDLHYLEEVQPHPDMPASEPRLVAIYC